MNRGVFGMGEERDGRGSFMEESGEKCRLCINCYRTGYSECIDVANSYLISYSNSSLLECPPAVQADRVLTLAVKFLSLML